MKSFKPSFPYNVPMALLIPTYSRSQGVVTKTFPTIDKGIRFNASFRTFGGTERDVNGVYSVVDTATVETWFRPDIKADCRIVELLSGEIYEIVNNPEDINKRHQYLLFKVKNVKGGA